MEGRMNVLSTLAVYDEDSEGESVDGEEEPPDPDTVPSPEVEDDDPPREPTPESVGSQGGSGPTEPDNSTIQQQQKSPSKVLPEVIVEEKVAVALVSDAYVEEKVGLVSEAYGEDDISKLEGEEERGEDEEDDANRQTPSFVLQSLPGRLPVNWWVPVTQSPLHLVSEAYGEDDISKLEGDEERGEDEEDEADRQTEFSELEKKDPQELVASFSEKVRNMSPDEIKIPPEPLGRCSNHLQDKIQKLYEKKMKEGMDMNFVIQRKKEFRNPSIYEKLIQYCSIDELGTNYPKDMFDPHGWSEDSYYEALTKSQKIEMDKLEKAKKERTKIEFVTGTKKGAVATTTAATTTTVTTTTGTDAQKRKSKWDSAVPVTTVSQPIILTTTATLPAVVTVTTSTSGSKTTIISAVGTIAKKAKQ